MDYLVGLNEGECRANHLPNTPTNRIKILNAGAVKLGVCPVDSRLDHVQFAPGLTIERSTGDEQDALVIIREGSRIARIVPTPGTNAFTIETSL